MDVVARPCLGERCTRAALPAWNYCRDCANALILGPSPERVIVRRLSETDPFCQSIARDPRGQGVRSLTTTAAPRGRGSDGAGALSGAVSVPVETPHSAPVAPAPPSAIGAA